MEHNTNKDEWIETILGSTRGMRSAQPGAGLYERIVQRMDATPKAKTTIPWARWAAAAILLLAVNAGTLVYYARQNNKNTLATNGNPIAQEIKSVSTYNY